MENLMEKLLDFGRRLLPWLLSKPNRLRVCGHRIEVMAFIVTRNPEPSILLGQSVYHKMWMPPQEGVNLNESFREALHRCLEIECGIDLPPDRKALARHMYERSCRFVGIIPLHPDRQGERLVADDAPGTVFEAVKLRRKAYWMSIVLVRSQGDLAPKPDGKELTAFRWCTFPNAEEAIRTTNHPQKAELLLDALKKCRQDLSGGLSPKERAALADGA